MEDFQTFLLETHDACSTLDCIATIEFIAKQYFSKEIVFDRSGDTFAEQISNNLSKFIKISNPNPGDIIVFKGPSKEQLHIGIMLTKTEFIHHYNNTISVQKLNKVWRLFIYGFYSYTG